MDSVKVLSRERGEILSKVDIVSILKMQKLKLTVLSRCMQFIFFLVHLTAIHIISSYYFFWNISTKRHPFNMIS